MIKFPGLFLFLLITVCAHAQATRQQPKPRYQDSLTHALQQVYKQGVLAGFSVAIVNDQGPLYEGGMGYANLATRQPYTAHTIQNLGSVSKTLVGIAILKAQELGKLRLDDPINRYLPFRVENPFFPELPITIRQLATHTSTITDNAYYLTRNYVQKPGQDTRYLKLQLEDEQVINPPDSLIPMPAFLQRVLASDGSWYRKEDFLQHRPGERFEYSNVGTALVAYIVERATGEDFKKFTARHILQPLRMNASGWAFEAVPFERFSRLYYTIDTLLPFYTLITYPDGNFISSANDLGKFLTELIRGYEGKGTILSATSYREYYRQQLTAAHLPERNEGNPYSDEYNLGILIGFSAAGNIGHTGGDPGVSTMLFFNAASKIGRLLIVNTSINSKQDRKVFSTIWNTLEEYQARFPVVRPVRKGRPSSR